MKDLRAGEKAATEKEDRDNIKRSIGLYKQQMDEELDALDDGQQPIDAAMQQYGKAQTLAEKKKLKLRIERLVKGDTKVKESRKAVDKALSYMQDADTETTGNDRYLELATADDIRNDARIKAAKAKIKDDEKYAGARKSIASHERAISENKKLLGKGNDAAIMKIIAIHRNAMLKAVSSIE